MPFLPPSHTPYQWQNAPSTNTPLDAAHLEAAESDLVTYTQQTAELLGVAATNVKTSNYSASGGDFIPVDATSGSITVTLPTAPADQTRVGVKLVITSSAHTGTVACGGSDAFNKAGGSTTLVLASVNQSVLLQYQASTNIWHVQASDIGLSMTASGAIVSRNSQLALRDWPHIKDYGAKGGTQTFSHGVVSGTSFTDTTASPFVPTDVGKVIIIPGTGDTGRNFATTIGAYVSASHVTLTTAPPNSGGATGAYQYGWDDTVAVQAALNANGRISFGPDTYLWTSVGPQSGSILDGIGAHVWQIPYTAFTTGSTISSGVAQTTVSCSPLPIALNEGQSVIICSGSNSNSFFAHATAAGATSISTTSWTPTHTYAAGSSLQLVPYGLIDVLVPNTSAQNTTLNDGVTMLPGIEVRGFDLHGVGTAGYTNSDAIRQAAVYVQQMTEVIIRDNKADGFFDEGFTARSCQKVWMLNNRVTNSCLAAGRNALMLGDTSNGTAATQNQYAWIENNYVNNCPTVAVNLQTHWTTVTSPASIIITGNYLSALQPIGVEIGNAGSRIQQVIISDNVCNSTGTGFTAGIYVADDGAGASDATKIQDYIISGNYCTGTFGLGGITYWGSRATITDNVVVNNGGFNCLYINQNPTSLGVNSFLVADNLFYCVGNVTNHIIDIENASHFKVRGNLLLGSASASNAGHGMRFKSCSFFSAEENRIENTYQTGIYLDTVSDFKIRGNTVYNPNVSNTGSSSLGDGIYMTAVTGTQNVIEDNVIYDDRGTHQMQYGILVAASYPVRLIGNTLTGAVVHACNGAGNANLRVWGNHTDDPNSFPAAPSQPAAPSSGSAYTNATSYDQVVIIAGGTVTANTFTRNGGTSKTLWTGTAAALNMTLTLRPGDAFTMTYTVAPTLTVLPIS